MTSKFFDVYNNFIKYEGHVIYIAFHKSTMNPYFNANQVCQMLGYNNVKKALNTNVEKKNILPIRDIVVDYKILYKNIQGSTKFLSESGLYSLILKSRKDNAREITDWITNEVMPSIRKRGEYKLNHKFKKQIDRLNLELENLRKELILKANENDVLKHDMKSQTYPVGGVIYILRVVTKSLDLDADEIIDIKIGMSKNFKLRKNTIDSTTKHKTQVLKTIKVKKPKIIEQCVIEKLEIFQIKHKKEYFSCSYNQAIQTVAECVKFYENRDIDTSLESKKIERAKIDNFDPDKKVYVRVSHLEDNEQSNICSDNDSDDESDEDDGYDSDEDDDNEILKQVGGDTNFEMLYLKNKIKYVQLKFSLL